MAGSYADFLAMELAPPWLREPNAEALLRALGEARDALADASKAGVLARLARPGSAPDALARIGADRMMPQGPAEVSDAYAARLVAAWETWPWAGTPFGVLSALRLSGLGDGAQLWTASGARHVLALDGSEVITTPGPPLWLGQAGWSAFALVWPAGAWPYGVVPAPGSDTANFVHQLIDLWKPAYATFSGTFIHVSGAQWGDGEWGSQTWGGAVTHWPSP